MAAPWGPAGDRWNPGTWSASVLTRDRRSWDLLWLHHTWLFPALRRVLMKPSRITDVCRRNPWGLGSLLGRHPGETGIVLYGRFKRLIYWPPPVGWEIVTVSINGTERARLDQAKRGPLWISLNPGEHVVEFSGLDPRQRLWSGQLKLAEQDAVLLAFKPPTWLPFTSPGPGRWCVRGVR